MKSSLRILLYLTGILIAALALLSSCTPITPTNQVNISLSEAIALSKSNNIRSIVVDSGAGTMTITATVSGPPLQITNISGTQTLVTDGTQLVANIDSLNLSNLQQLGLVLPADYSTTSTSNNSLGNTLISWFPLILLFVLLFFLFRSSGGVKNQVTSFSRSRARLNAGNTPTVTFADVAGVEEAKQDQRK